MESHKAVESLQQSNTDHGTWVAKKLLACTNTKLQFFPWPRSIQCFGSTGFHKIVLCWHPFLQSNEIWFGKLLWLSKVCLPCSSAWVNLASKPWPATCGTSITSALGAAWAHAWQPCFAFYLWHCLGLCLCLGCRLGFGMWCCFLLGCSLACSSKVHFASWPFHGFAFAFLQLFEYVLLHGLQIWWFGTAV